MNKTLIIHIIMKFKQCKEETESPKHSQRKGARNQHCIRLLSNTGS